MYTLLWYILFIIAHIIIAHIISVHIIIVHIIIVHIIIVFTLLWRQLVYQSINILWIIIVNTTDIWFQYSSLNMTYDCE